MAKYSAFKHIPIDMRALMSEVGNRTGHHYYFDRPVTCTGEMWPSCGLPHPLMAGTTVRIFGYASVDNGGFLMTCIEMGYTFYMRSAIGQNGIHTNMFLGYDKKESQIVPEPEIRVKSGTFVSLAVRIEDLTHLTAYFNRRAERKEEVGSLDGSKYTVYYSAQWYTILSLHLTCETETSATLWGFDSSFMKTYLLLHSTVMYTIRAFEDDPDDFYIKINNQKAYFDMGKGKVKAGEQFMYSVLRTREGFVITVDFLPTKKHSFLKADPYDDQEVSFYERVDIMRVEGLSHPSAPERHVASSKRLTGKGPIRDYKYLSLSHKVTKTITLVTTSS